MASGDIFSIAVATTITILTFVKTEFDQSLLMKPLPKFGISLVLSLIVYSCMVAFTRAVADGIGIGEGGTAAEVGMALALALVGCGTLLCVFHFYWLGGAVVFFFLFDLMYLAATSSGVDPASTLALNPPADVASIVIIPFGALLLLRYRTAQNKAHIRASELEAEKAEIVAMIRDALSKASESGSEGPTGETVGKNGKKKKGKKSSEAR
jgi:hypothetical protein